MRVWSLSERRYFTLNKFLILRINKLDVNGFTEPVDDFAYPPLCNTRKIPDGGDLEILSWQLLLPDTCRRSSVVPSYCFRDVTVEQHVQYILGIEILAQNSKIMWSIVFQRNVTYTVHSDRHVLSGVNFHNRHTDDDGCTVAIFLWEHFHVKNHTSKGTSKFLGNLTSQTKLSKMVYKASWWFSLRGKIFDRQAFLSQPPCSIDYRVWTRSEVRWWVEIMTQKNSRNSLDKNQAD